MDIEWSGIPGPFTWDFLLAETIGLQAGNYPYAYHEVGPRASAFSADGKLTDAQKTVVSRAEWAMRFTHELMSIRWGQFEPKGLELLTRQFGYGTPECEVLNYWNDADRTADQPHIAVPDNQIKWIGIWKPKERALLLVLVNWTASLRQSKIQVTPPTGVVFDQWKDAETGNPVEAGNVSLQGWEVKLVNVSSSVK